jgi:hypothetical protein
MKIITPCVPLVFLGNASIGNNLGAPGPQLQTFDAYYSDPPTVGLETVAATVNLVFAPLPQYVVSGYRVYRSILGFVAPIPLPSALAGLTLMLSISGGPTQTVTFNGVDDVITAINLAVAGGRAIASVATPTNFIFRVGVSTVPGSLQIVGGTALSLLGLTARTITTQSEFGLLAAVPAPVDPTVLVEFDDLDGMLQDYYAISTLDSSGNESLKTAFIQPTTATGPVCVVQGIVTDLQGARLVDAEVRSILKVAPTSLVDGSLVSLRHHTTVLTGPDGRFNLPLLQGALVQIEIRATGFSRYVTIPAQAFVNLTDLEVDLHYQFLPDPLLGEI